MNKYTRTLLTSSLLIIFLPSTVQAQNYVERLTRSIEVATSNGNVYSEIRVVCTGSKGTRYIVRGQDSSKWCVNLDGAVCKGNKLAAANKACGLDSGSVITQSLASSSAEIANVTSTKAVESSSAKRVVASNRQAVEHERRMIEEEREKIKARRKELELRKTELESIVFSSNLF